MPYIPKEDRKRAATAPHKLKPGELTFALTKLTLDWIGDKLTYTELNDALGALECVKMELYRRMVAPYEDAKRAENGDVYPLEVAPGKFRYSEPLDGRPKKYPTLPPDEHYPGCICVLCVA